MGLFLPRPIGTLFGADEFSFLPLPDRRCALSGCGEFAACNPYPRRYFQHLERVFSSPLDLLTYPTPCGQGRLFFFPPNPTIRVEELSVQIHGLIFFDLRLIDRRHPMERLSSSLYSAVDSPYGSFVNRVGGRSFIILPSLFRISEGAHRVCSKSAPLSTGPSRRCQASDTCLSI